MTFSGSGLSSRWKSGLLRSGWNAGLPFIRSISLTFASPAFFQTATAAVQQSDGDVLIVGRLAAGALRQGRVDAGDVVQDQVVVGPVQQGELGFTLSFRGLLADARTYPRPECASAFSGSALAAAAKSARASSCRLNAS